MEIFEKTAGSPELEFSIHTLAMVCNLVKSPLARLAASGGTLHYPDRDMRDTSAFVAEFANGVRFEYAFSCYAGPTGAGCIIIGDKGVLRHEGNDLFLSHGNGKPQPVAYASGPAAESPDARMYRDFFESVATRKPSVLSPRVALEPAKIAYAVDISLAQKRFATAEDFA